MYLLIQQAQPITWTTLEIVLMSLFPAIIGIIITYLFCKSKFNKEIKAIAGKLEKSKEREEQLKSEAYELNSKVAELVIASTTFEKDNRELSKLLLELEKKLEESQRELSAISKTVHKTEEKPH